MFTKFSGIKLPFTPFVVLAVGIGVGLGYLHWGRDTHKTPTHIVQITESFPDMNFMAEVHIGDQTELFLVDTGAGRVMLTTKLANRLHLTSNNASVVGGVGGRAISENVIIPSMRVGPIEVHKVEAGIVDSPYNLLGMPFINELSRFEIKGRVLTLEQE